MFPRAAIMKYHKLSGLKWQKFILSHYQKLEIQNQCVGRSPFPPKPLREDTFLSLPASDSPRNSLARGSITPILAFIASCLPCVSACVSSFYKDTSHIGLGYALIHYDLILTWLHMQWPDFWIKSHSQVPGVRTPTSFGWTQTHNKHLLSISHLYLGVFSFKKNPIKSVVEFTTRMLLNLSINFLKI